MHITELPFVTITDLRVNPWAVEPTGIWDENCETGTHYAELLIRFLQESGNAPFFTSVLKKVCEGVSGIETGFLYRIADVLSDKG
jgi:hypothetical protein